jgi:hypothetical protein
MKQSIRRQRPLRRPDVWLRQAGGENAVFDPETGNLHLLNDTALAIWQLCDGETWPEEMVVAICEVTGLHEDVVTKDIGRILTDFQHSGLLKSVD